MSDSTRDAIGRGWRLVVVVLACLLALALPYLVVTGLVDRGSSTDLSLIAGAPPTLATATSRSPSTSASGASTATTGSGEVTGAGTDATGLLAEATESCRLATLRLSAALAAANVSLAQFDKHIDAMNLLVAGKISLAVATQFWEETRVGATENSAAFRRAQAELAANRASCSALPAAAAEGLPYGQVDRLSQCVKYVGAATTAVVRADPAVDTWMHHIHDMEMLRAGDITPAQATAAWKRDWRTGEKQLRAFEAAHKQASSLRCALT
jgi:hypothetical protein